MSSSVVALERICKLRSHLSWSPANACQKLQVSKVATKSSKGDISSVFNSLSGDEYVWDPRFRALKAEIAPTKQDRDRLKRAWSRLNAALDTRLARLARLQEKAVPVVDFTALRPEHGSTAGEALFWPATVVAQIKQAGCVVVRNVVPAAQARRFKAQALDYARRNPSFTGFPADNPQGIPLS